MTILLPTINASRN